VSGILDNKSRVFDTIVTLEGKRQLSMGGVDIKYVTFTDSATFYQADIISGSTDPTTRIYLEACHLPQDKVTFQADNLGKLLPFENELDLGLSSGQLLNYSFITGNTLMITGSNERVTTLTGDALWENVDPILATSIDNFQKQRALATIDTLWHDEEDFALGNNEIEFVIHNEKPVQNQNNFIANINHLEDIFEDPRFSRLDNFKYLPPINRVDDVSIDKSDHRNVANYALGQYVPWGRSHVFKLTNRDVCNELDHFAKMGYSKLIKFDPTSRDNNLFMQAFEVSNDTMFKLDVIDYGKFHDNSDENSPVKHIFFVGKLMTKQESATHTFVHLFSLVFG